METFLNEMQFINTVGYLGVQPQYSLPVYTQFTVYCTFVSNLKDLFSKINSLVLILQGSCISHD